MSTTIFAEALLSGSRIEPGPSASGGDAAYHARLEALRPLLVRTASAILRRSDDAEDAVQEALLRLVRNAGSFDPRKGTLAVFARTTVRRVALDMLARLAPRPSVAADAAEAPVYAEPLEAEEVRGRLRRAVDALPDPQRVAFLLVHQEGLKHEDAAKELNIAQETLRARLYRARIGLRAALKEFAP
ncbi:MAG: sigma-70 family RNA polymerase sigma factor [Planctomycetes bacterium]|nr:sigma-70 family RNA polymerase sigma factor [Planctomycetota bacterium]